MVSIDSERLDGLHHVTAITTSPACNIAFYTQILGLQLVKKTVNFDDPHNYHLYYGDGEGSPGSILTFFSWPGTRRGSRGVGQVMAAAFAVPYGSLGYWYQRLRRRGFTVDTPKAHFGDERVVLLDPDGLQVHLVASGVARDREPWTGGPVPTEFAVRGIHGISLLIAEAPQTMHVLTDLMGFELEAEAEGIHRLAIGEGSARARIDVIHDADGGLGRMSGGTVHHVAWRVANVAAQEVWRKRLRNAGIEVTEPRDRHYFRSIYFREPGGVLFEIATDSPGFAIDEPWEHLGESLKLPPWLEDRREELEAALPPLGGNAAPA